MKTYQKTLNFHQSSRGTYNITTNINQVVKQSGIKTGLCQAFILHTSASLMITEKVTKAVLFGSRAKGTQKTGSDIDLAVMDDATRVADRLNEETLLPYYFDVVDMDALTNANLIEHIGRVGIDLFAGDAAANKMNQKQGHL